MDNRVKIHFQLPEPDEDDWPPATVESVWAAPGPSEGQYIIDNAPFFIRDATVGDIVQVREEEGNLWFEKTVQGSTNSLLRVIVFDPGKIEEIRQHLKSLGCYAEVLPNFKMVAVDIPIDVKLSTVQDYLQKESEAGRIDYEEPILRQDP